MSRGTGPLPDGWDESIPEGIWADALIAAVRSDLGAFGSARVRDTLRRWRNQARTAPDPEVRAQAAAHLRAVGDAVAHVPEPASEARSERRRLDLARLARPKESVEEAELDGEEATGDHVETLDPGRRVAAPSTGASPAKGRGDDRSAPYREFAEDDEHPTMLRDFIDQLPMRPQLYRAARSDPLALDLDGPRAESEYDEKPTASISIPDELQALHRRTSTEHPTVPPIRIPDEETNKLPSRKVSALDELGQPLGQEERTVGLAAPGELGAQPPPLPAVLPPPALASPAALEAGSQSAPPPVPLDDEGDLVESKPSSFGLAPKPGIVRRSAVVRRASPARPRAAMQQVRALHAVVVPLCEELIPLSVERRSRRFWARWREVAGDRGVRREFVEGLLMSAKDVRTLVCELIAEVQTVDVRSVYALVEKLESSQTQERPTGARPGATPERQRGPLVGAQIRVEGVSVDDRDD